MSPELNLYRALAQASYQILKGEGYLTIPSKYHNSRALGFLGRSFSRAGKYSIRGKQTIYLFDGIDTIRQEVAKYYCEPLLSFQFPRSLRPIRFLYSLKQVFDFTQPSLQQQLGITSQQFTLNSTILTTANNDKLSSTQALGEIARDLGIEALKVPVNLAFNSHYLVIFRDNLLPDSSIKTIDIEKMGEYELNFHKSELPQY